MDAITDDTITKADNTTVARPTLPPAQPTSSFWRNSTRPWPTPTKPRQPQKRPRLNSCPDQRRSGCCCLKQENFIRSSMNLRRS